MRQPAPITEDGHGPDAGEMTSYVCLIQSINAVAQWIEHRTLSRENPGCSSSSPCMNESSRINCSVAESFQAKAIYSIVHVCQGRKYNANYYYVYIIVAFVILVITILCLDLLL